MKNKIGLIVLMVMIVTNPLSGAHVLELLDIIFQQLFLLSPYISMAGAVYLTGLLGYYMYQGREQVKVPSKPKKRAVPTKAYLET